MGPEASLVDNAFSAACILAGVAVLATLLRGYWLGRRQGALPTIALAVVGLTLLLSPRLTSLVVRGPQWEIAILQNRVRQQAEDAARAVLSQSEEDPALSDVAAAEVADFRTDTPSSGGTPDSGPSAGLEEPQPIPAAPGALRIELLPSRVDAEKAKRLLRRVQDAKTTKELVQASQELSEAVRDLDPPTLRGVR